MEMARGFLAVFIAALCFFVSSAQKVCTQEAVADIVFLVDGSWSIGIENFQQIRAFLQSLVGGFAVGPEQVRIGLVQYSTTPRTEFLLNTYQDKQEILHYIASLPYKGGGTMTGLGLDFMLKEHFVESAGDRARDGVPQIAVVITDGKSQDNVEPHAQNLKRKGITLFAIGIKDADEEQLKEIANQPHDQHVYSVSDFAALQGISQSMVQVLCTTVKAKISQAMQACPVDIAIGFDVSHRTTVQSLFSGQAKLQADLPEIVRYVSGLQSLCCVSQGSLNVSVGLRLVSADGRVTDDFGFQRYNEDVVKKLMVLQTTEATAFNGQLLRSFREKFNSSTAAVKVLIIFTDGLDAAVEDLQLEWDHLRTSGVHALLTVALVGVRNTNDLQKLEFGRGFGYKQPLTIGMQSVASAILEQIDTVASRECCGVMCKCTGQEGIQGPRGPSGTQGSPRQKGHIGFPGEEGEIGDAGLPGLNGTRGHQGCPGESGKKGTRGYSGNRGGDGEQGMDGMHGEQGTTGLAGVSGGRGGPGSPGQRGTCGAPGVRGKHGLRGDPGESGLDNTVQGPKGQAGEPGMQGETGVDGRPGPAGEDGKLGSPGRRGPAGPSGARGPPGSAGLQGTPGPSGPLGPSGLQGFPGQRGIPGLPGPQGGSGTPGPNGAKGSPGPRDQKGMLGNRGDQGAAGPTGARGLLGMDGAPGYGAPGPKGRKGNSGFPGCPGLQGESGDASGSGGGGPKGSQGRGGNSGMPGHPGDGGTPGLVGHRGPKGRRGARDMSACQLITYVRDNCVCCHGHTACPAYPTDLVFGLDMSEDITTAVFERQRSVLLSLLDGIHVAESNCPTGTRVSVVGYSAHTMYLIRFSDHRHKRHLLEAVRNISHKLTTSRRDLGSTMRFVARNVFKRVRQGVLMRKVAVFLTNGPSQDAMALITAVLEFKALDIALGVIALRNTPDVRRAFQADESSSFTLAVLEQQQDPEPELSRIQQCVICYDPCSPAGVCNGTHLKPKPQQVDLDLAMLVDGSRQLREDELPGVQQLLGSVLDELAVSSQPGKADGQARVALYQQSSSYAAEGRPPVRELFGLQRFQDRDAMKRQVFSELWQTGGSSTLGRAVEHIVVNVLLNTPQSRRNRMVLAVVGGETSYDDRAKLAFVSRLARCKGVVLLVLTVGDSFNRTEVEELASLPLDQHLLYLGQVEQDYAQRFIRTFLHILSRRMNTYPAASLSRQCEGLLEAVEGHIDSNMSLREFLLLGVPAPPYTAEEEEEEYTEPTGRGQEYVQTGSGGQASSGSGDFNEQTALQQTVEATATSEDVCLLRQAEGSCQEYVLRWYYDSMQSECSLFWYGGCGGNRNRFETQEDCETSCVTVR